MLAEPLFDAIVSLDDARAAALVRGSPGLVAARDPYLGSTPLHFAAHRGLEETVGALLAAGADVHAREEASGTTALHWAAEAGQLGVAELLLAAKADVGAIDAWYALPPLGWATVVDWAPHFRADRPGTIAGLRRAGAQPDLFTAVAEGNAEEVATLAAVPGALERRLGFVADGWTPLHLAADRAGANLVKQLVSLGADVRARTTSGLTPFAVARAVGNANAARALRSVSEVGDASVAVVTRDQAALAAALAALSDTAQDADLPTRLLGVAAGTGNAAAIGLLVGRGADVRARVQTLVGERPAWVTPLHLAAREGHLDVIVQLLDRGADLHAGREDGTPTPVEVAAEAGQAAVVQLLVESGADAPELPEAPEDPEGG